ncbi:MAG TPA: YdbH domain-containing protein [Geminicoccaceae bacterium]|nr:YdbH domain-containing protein [Geminicoccaceae bacterium]
MLLLALAAGGPAAAEPVPGWPGWLAALGVREVALTATRLRLELPAGRLELVVGGRATAEDGRLRLDLAGREGALVLPAAGLALDLARVTLRSPPDRGGGEAVMRLEARRLRPSGGPAPARAPALNVDARLRGATIALVARLFQDPEGTLLRAEGHHELATGEGRLVLSGEPVRFAPEGLQPAALVPQLEGVVEAVSGEVGITGEIAWGPRPRERVQLLMRDLSFTTPASRIERLSGAVSFTGLFPPRTPEGQQLAVALVDVGLPLANGLASLALRPDGRLHLDELAFELAGGRLSAGPLDVPLGAGAVELVLTAQGLELGRLLELVELEGLTGTGTIDGRLPVEVVLGEGVAVRGGRLESRGPGVIRYAPATPPAGLAAGGASVDLMLQALRDFRYDSLSMTLDGRTEGEMLAGLKVAGRNPELYGGYPVEFNLNLEGQLASIVRRGIDAYQIPESIARRLGEFFR